MSRLVVFSFLVCALSYAITYEKHPGATNPHVDAGDAYTFLCTPLDSKLGIDTQGRLVAIGTKKILGKLPGNNIGAGFYLTYLECFVTGNDLIAVYEESNAEDSGIVATRFARGAPSGKWKLDVASLNLEPPRLQADALTLVARGVELDVDPSSGKIKGSRGAQCVRVQRRDSGRKVENLRAGQCAGQK